MIILPGLAKIILLKNDPILLLFHPGLRVYIINFEIVGKKKMKLKKIQKVIKSVTETEMQHSLFLPFLKNVFY